ncbi:MAG: hypothetical protein IPM54_12495 [Polyangiaceae bacterium]|nr:hypothetical protein [Polyangiaceae bacterium]
MMTKAQIAFSSLLASTVITVACDYVPPAGSNDAGGNGQGGSGEAGSSSATSSGQGGMGGRGETGSSTSSGQGGMGGSNSGSSSSGQGGTAASSSSSSSSGEVAVNCDVAECLSPNICCIEPGTPPARTCRLAGECPDIVVACNGPEDCPKGTVCCGSYNLNVALYTGIECLKECDIPNYQFHTPILLTPRTAGLARRVTTTCSSVKGTAVVNDER